MFIQRAIPTSGVSSRTPGSMRSYGSLPMASPLRLVRKLTQHPSAREVPSVRIRFAPSPYWRNISRDRGFIAWALGAANRWG